MFSCQFEINCLTFHLTREFRILFSSSTTNNSTKEAKKMNITTWSNITVLNAALGGLTLLMLAASPTLADNHSKTINVTPVFSATNEVKLSQEQRSQTQLPTNQTNQMQCSCCQKMMNNMPGMMNNMPGRGTTNMPEMMRK